MKYLHEGFCSELDAIEQEVDAMVEEIAEENGVWGVPTFYKGIRSDALRAVEGVSSWRELIERWDDFPPTWPWLEK
jgi:hypothetical protein